MKYEFIINKMDRGYTMQVLTENPFDDKIPDNDVSIIMDYLNTVKAQSKMAIDKNFYDAEYFAEYGRSEKSGLVNYEAFSKNFASEHANRVEKITGGDKTKRILEIGCAFGWTVDELRKRGYDAYGCDISEWVVNKYKRDYITRFDWAKDIMRGYQYDLIYSFATFEHFACEDVRNVFNNVKNNLSNNGILFATIDNIWGQDLSHQSVRPREWWNSIAKEHVFKIMEKETEIFKPINGYVWQVK
jgi:2-polyprenyl-3-methyl-5-hydroxy-6-metoxy-1,4-benzoquinol methylase